MQKRIVIFGSTGSTGKELVTQSLKQANYKVTAFARSPEKLNVLDTNLKIIQGDVLNFEDVSKAVENQDIVLCSILAHLLPINQDSGQRQQLTL